MTDLWFIQCGPVMAWSGISTLHSISFNKNVIEACFYHYWSTKFPKLARDWLAAQLPVFMPSLPTHAHKTTHTHTQTYTHTPWTSSLSNHVTVHVPTQLAVMPGPIIHRAIDCRVIATGSEAQCQRLIVIYGFITSCKGKKMMCMLVWQIVYALTQTLFFVFISPVAPRKINTEIRLAWVHLNSSTLQSTHYSLSLPNSTAEI